jgi:hypothetical protein
MWKNIIVFIIVGLVCFGSGWIIRGAVADERIADLNRDFNNRIDQLEKYNSEIITENESFRITIENIRQLFAKEESNNIELGKTHRDIQRIGEQLENGIEKHIRRLQRIKEIFDKIREEVAD